MIRRTEITIEKHRTLIIRRRQRFTRRWCRQCLAEVQLITPDDAALVAGVSSRTIYRWIEDAGIHFTEDLGVLLVCEASLAEKDRAPGQQSSALQDSE
jgi:hypothetical protein